MPWKYLRMTRRCTCVTLDLTGRGKMNYCSGSFGTAAFFWLKKTTSRAGGSKNKSLFDSIKINPAEMYIYHTYLSTRNLPYNAYDVCIK